MQVGWESLEARVVPSESMDEDEVQWRVSPDDCPDVVGRVLR